MEKSSASSDSDNVQVSKKEIQTMMGLLGEAIEGVNKILGSAHWSHPTLTDLTVVKDKIRIAQKLLFLIEGK